MPLLLARNKLRLEDFDLTAIHESSAGQVEASIKVWEEGWKEAATGGRRALHLARELQWKNLKRGLTSICAAATMADAMLLERWSPMLR